MDCHTSEAAPAQWQELSLEEETALWWLGQAGFALRHGPVSLLIDPYLSDSLARKHAGTRFPHTRMMPAPVAADALGGVDCVCCTHRHTDHMDPETLTAIARTNPGCRFVIPRSLLTHATQAIGLSPHRILAMDAGECVDLFPRLSIVAIPAAHEDLAFNEAGAHECLGYVLRTGNVSVYHSGDCVPYAGLADILAASRVDLALLPVNGRDETRRAHHIPGNFDVEEAMALCDEAGIPWMMAHHFGMFGFNTVARAELAARIARAPAGVRVLLARTGCVFRFARRTHA